MPFNTIDPGWLSLAALRRFSQATGIKDPKLDMMVAGLDLQASHRPSTTMSDKAPPEPLTLEKVNALWQKLSPPTFTIRIDVYIPKRPWWRPWTVEDVPEEFKDKMPENLDEVGNWREWYEKELTLQDVLPKDGWIPKEA